MFNVDLSYLPKAVLGGRAGAGRTEPVEVLTVRCRAVQADGGHVHGHVLGGDHGRAPLVVMETPGPARLVIASQP